MLKTLCGFLFASVMYAVLKICQNIDFVLIVDVLVAQINVFFRYEF